MAVPTAMGTEGKEKGVALVVAPVRRLVGAVSSTAPLLVPSLLAAAVAAILPFGRVLKKL